MNYSYQIEGMHCQACVAKIKNALSSRFNVIDVSFNPPRLEIESDEEPALNDLNKVISQAGDYRLQLMSTSNVTSTTSNANKEGIGAYYPLFVIAVYIIGISFINNFNGREINTYGWMNQFMAGFFLVFSAFKFLDLRGFADGYSTYDLLAKHWHFYGYIYPFLELGLGILYLTMWFPIATPIATIVIMGFSSIGVIISLMKKQKFQCACLGTILKVPLSVVTLVEDLTMVVLAAVALITM